MFVLDNGAAPSVVPYGDNHEDLPANQTVTITDNDSPDGGRSDAPTPAGYMKVTVSMNLANYLQYRPTGSHSIYVTLMAIYWNWSATAIEENGVWQIVNPYYLPNPPGEDTYDEPTWNNYITNIHYTQ